MKVQSMEELLKIGLRDIYDAEKRIVRALPRMKKAACSEELATAFDEHLEQTEQQVARLERAFQELDDSPKRKMCDGMVGLLQEGDESAEEASEGPVRDAALIAAAQKVEHYEIAAYGTLREWARVLGHDEVANLLQETLDEEGETDKKLTQIAEHLNAEARAEDEEEEEEDGDEDDDEDEDDEEEDEEATAGKQPAGGRARRR